MHRSQVFYVSIVALVLYVSIAIGADDDKDPELDLNVNHSGYIDPHDMFNYNHNLLHVKPASRSGEEILKNEVTESISVTKDSGVPQSKLFKKELEDTCAIDKSLEEEIPFLLRFLRVFSNLVSLQAREINEGETIKVPITAGITRQYKAIIEEILSHAQKIPSTKLADIDEVLSNIFSIDEERLHNKFEGSFLQRLIQSTNIYAKDWMVGIFFLCVAHAVALALLGHSPKIIIGRSVIPLLMVSWYWHWYHLEEKAAAKRQSEMVKVSQLPEACNPEALSVWSSMKLFMSTTVFGYSDPCDEYHRALLTDPSYEVSPFQALIDMIAISIFHPLKYIGGQFGGFFDGVLSSTGLLTKTPVFIAVLLVVLLGLFVLCGYEFHTPFFKITNTRTMAAARVQSARETELILERALERQARRESAALECAAVLRVQPVETAAVTDAVLEELTQSGGSTVLHIQQIVSSCNTRQDLREDKPQSKVAEFSKTQPDLTIHSQICEDVTRDIQPGQAEEETTSSSEVEIVSLPSRALEETV